MTSPPSGVGGGGTSPPATLGVSSHCPALMGVPLSPVPPFQNPPCFHIFSFPFCQSFVVGREWPPSFLFCGYFLLTVSSLHRGLPSKQLTSDGLFPLLAFGSMGLYQFFFPPLFCPHFFTYYFFCPGSLFFPVSDPEVLVVPFIFSSPTLGSLLRCGCLFKTVFDWTPFSVSTLFPPLPPLSYKSYDTFFFPPFS